MFLSDYLRIHLYNLSLGGMRLAAGHVTGSVNHVQSHESIEALESSGVAVMRGKVHFLTKTFMYCTAEYFSHKLLSVSHKNSSVLLIKTLM